jgi:hypothetical protein
MANPTTYSDPVVIAAILGPILSAVLAAALGIWVDRKYYRRPKLITWWGHISTHTIPVPGQADVIVNTHSVGVHNLGTAAAHTVRVTVSTLENIYFQINPVTAHHVEDLGGKARAILIPVLAPKQGIQIQFVGLNVPTAAVMQNCVCDEQVAKHPRAVLRFQLSKTRRAVYGGLMGAGAVALLILVVRATAAAWRLMVG